MFYLSVAYYISSVKCAYFEINQTAYFSFLLSWVAVTGSAGGAYSHNVPAKNDQRSSEGHRCLSCRFHTDSKYSVMLNHTHGFQVAGSYFEGWGHGRPSSLVRDLENTGPIDLFSVHMVDVRQEERKVMKSD